MVDFPIKRLLIMIWILIGILLLTNMVISYRIHNFERDCVETYDIDGECPCEVPKSKIMDTLPPVNITILENSITNSS